MENCKCCYCSQWHCCPEFSRRHWQISVGKSCEGLLSGGLLSGGLLSGGLLSGGLLSGGRSSHVDCLWQWIRRWGKPFISVFYPLFSPMSWYPITILSHHCNSPKGSGEAKVKSCVLRNMTRQTALFNTRPLNPEAPSNWQTKSAVGVWVTWVT
jgi:hypothetical protein